MPATNQPPTKLHPRSLGHVPTRGKHHAPVTCEDATDLICEYLAENLNPDRRRAFESHLSGCRDCAAFLATYKRTIDLTKSFLRSEPLQVAPVDFKLRLPSAH